MAHNNKNRLFEVMSKVDNSFKIKLNEDVYNESKWGTTKANPKYTHFAVNKGSGLIETGWDYTGYDQEELRLDKKHYFLNDLIDWEIDPKSVTILTKKSLLSKGINPFDYNNWVKR